MAIFLDFPKVLKIDISFILIAIVYLFIDIVYLHSVDFQLIRLPYLCFPRGIRRKK